MASVVVLVLASPGCPGEPGTGGEAGGKEESPLPEIDADGLVVTVRPVPPLSASGAVNVETTVRNPTDATRTFCDYHTPFEGIQNIIFEVHDADGNDVPYGGIMGSRIAPGPDAFIALEPGASRSVTVDISGDYELPVGSYTVAFKGGLVSGLPDSEAVSIEVGP